MNPGSSLRAALVASVVVLFSGVSAHASDAVDKFFGSYVGSGTAERVDRKESEIHDLDVTVESYKDDGFKLKWITVVRGADGARTGEDVKRREVEENFVPVEDKENVFVLSADGVLFQKSELPNPLLGQAISWASIDGNVMKVYSLAIGETGTSELQVYRRTLTEKGMGIVFIRLQDDDVKVRMQGTLVRTQ